MRKPKADGGSYCISVLPHDLARFPGGLQKIAPVEGIWVGVICGFFEVPSNLRLYPE